MSAFGPRILVLGVPGAGKSHLARRLGEILRLTPVHLDRLLASPSVGNQPREEWEAVMRDLTSEPRWIIDGHYSSTLPIRMAAADTVVLLDVSVARCIWRVWRRQGTKRPDWPANVPERRDAEFFRLLRYTASEGKAILSEVYETFRDHAPSGAALIHLAGVQAQRRFLSQVEGGLFDRSA